MLVYVGRRYTVTVQGSTTKQVACEKCHTLYGYSLAATTTGIGRSPYYADNSGAKRRAHERAHQNLHYALNNRVEAVPCPTCGWLQGPMADVIRSRQFGWMLALSIVAWCIGGLLWFITFAISAASSFQDWYYMLTAVPIAGGGFALLAYRKRLQAAYDPNLNHAARAGRPSAGSFVVPVARTAPPAPVAAPRIPWFYVKDGRREGPISATDLSGLASQGHLSAADLVWTPAMTDWAPVGSIPELAAY
ncbi:MAG TPA: DUF4339 domain-containing protein [Tepidisphaeraceae bacterium]|jgi:hypothetical protein|nr:DUF4339 domain-containing protein [Tepidisphaeraceae bacterium]